ncbi:MAG: hypothetical protein IPK79_07495 [Vampirovibrionales bacterium]|nr:hypothetical protein [Vampirovibrionales bacterium]
MRQRLLSASLALALSVSAGIAAAWAGEITGSVSALSVETVNSPEMGAGMDRVSVVIQDAEAPERELTLYYPLGRLSADTSLGMVYKRLLKGMDGFPPMMMGGMCPMRAAMGGVTRPCCAKMAPAASDVKAKCTGKTGKMRPCAKNAPEGMRMAPWGKPVSFVYDDASQVIRKTTFWAKKPCCAKAPQDK